MIRAKHATPAWLQILKLSRPAFWIYLAGPYLIGYTAYMNGPHDYLRFPFWYSLFFFLIPANCILYGINDLYDQDTDRFNSKKEGDRESRVTDTNKNLYWQVVGASFLFSIPMWFYLPIFGRIVLALFFLLAVFYSAKPVRFKAKPFVDSFSNILYAFPAFIAVYQLTSNGLTLPVFFAALFWTTAMHLFSAIPDIQADKQAHLRTTATMLGRQKSLYVCFALWTLAAAIAVMLRWQLIFLAVYPAFMWFIIKKPHENLEKLYWTFPYLNMATGFLLYLVVYFS